MFRLILTAGIISLLAACSSMSDMSRSSGMPDTATLGAPGANEAYGPSGLIEGW